MAESRNLILRFAALLLTLGAAGIPLNEPFRLVVFFLAAIWLGTGRLRLAVWNWAAALVVVVLVTVGSPAIPIPHIQEGHNLFLRVADGEVLERELPTPVYERMRKLFDLQYPQASRCGDRAGCWARPDHVPDRVFAFSADGAWSQPNWSRVVSDISFDGIRTLRLGDINRIRYNYWRTEPQDIDRTSTPYFVAWQIPDRLVGSRLCWRGETMWGRGQTFASDRHDQLRCREFVPEDAGATVFGLGIAPDTLEVYLEKSTGLQTAAYSLLALRIVGILAIAALLAIPTMNTLLVAVLSGSAFLILTVTRSAPTLSDLNEGWIPAVQGMLTKMPIFLGGDDGLTYEGWGRTMLQHALRGDWSAFLRAEEGIYYFQPGLRYFRAVERALFGDTAYGYLLLTSMFPVVLYRLTSYVTRRWIALAVVAACLLGMGASFGLAFPDYVYWTTRGLAEPLAYMLFLLALLFGFRVVDWLSARDAALCGLLLTAAIWLRTNLSIGALALLAMLSIWLVRQRAGRVLAALATTSALTLLIPLHNVYFGGRLVLLSLQVDHKETLLMTPAAYASALGDLLSGDATSAAVLRMLVHLKLWLGTGGGSIPVHLALLTALTGALIFARTFVARMLAAVACALQIPLLFWRPESRFGLLSWLVALLAVLVFVCRLVPPAYRSLRLSATWEKSVAKP